MAAELSKRREIEDKIVRKALDQADYRKALLADPKAVIEREGGGRLPAGVEVKVLEENVKTIYLVLPMSQKALAAELSPAQLENIAGGTAGVRAEEMDIR